MLQVLKDLFPEDAHEYVTKEQIREGIRSVCRS